MDVIQAVANPVAVPGGGPSSIRTDVWQDLRREIEDCPGQVPVTVRERREILGRFLLLHESDLAELPPAEGDDSGHVVLRLRFRAPGAAQMLLALPTAVPTNPAVGPEPRSPG